MSSVRPVDEFRDRLCELLKRSEADLDAEERDVLRAVVRERRSGRRQRMQESASGAVTTRASEMVHVLESAARVLRPRETQALDDLVAGVQARPAAPPAYAPVRLRRRGR